MIKIILLCSLITAAAISFAQKQVYDLVLFTSPSGWKNTVKENTYTCYSSTNQQKKSYCQIFVMKSIESTGGIEDDFEKEWQNLVVKQYNPGSDPQTTEPETENGWKTKSGLSSFIFNGGTSSVLLTTISGHTKAISIIALTNSDDYLPAIQQFLESVEMKNEIFENNRIIENPDQPNSSISGFAFSSTNFEDGWVGTEHPDWVRLSKGNTLVLIHFTQPDIRDFNNLDEKTAFVWNTIIAPRYSNIANLWIRKSWYADGDFMNGKYYAEADLTENSTGKKVHVVLYKNGSAGKWLEIITPDKGAFERQFTIVYQQDGTNWDKLSVMGNYNKFAVSASDLPGNWYSAGGSNIQYYNVYTGNNAGMAFASSSTEISFYNNGTYKSTYKGVDNTLNNTGNRYYGEVFEGKCIVTNWEINLTNRLNGATETFSAQFESVKGGRILHMYRGNVEELHLFRLKK